MSRLSSYIIEQEEAGKLAYNEQTSTYEPTTKLDTTECIQCGNQTAQPIETPEGEAICLDCFTAQIDIAIDQQKDMRAEQ